ncbi:response regulator transcription factor [Actinomadura barringtoniae]|uniref:Response regulator transcription factor n=1 Tax=Actinomadura barringtoniae TaxID=1427535 RepID=A0A939PK31_9ACTN|nr:response regulator transcription factor [Actinomadura barringtoniae]MBO2453583.1 response regulator transcription factor [Actinomadura barringtoniae]
MTIRVLLVDDQEMVRAALRVVIDRREDLCVVGEAGDGQAAIEAAANLRPDVVVMDVRMPGMTGVEATRRIMAEWPHPGSPPRVLVLTTFDLDEYVHSALRAGASGFMLKNSLPDELANAIRVVAAGEAMLAPSVTHRLISAFAALPKGLVGAPPATRANARAGADVDAKAKTGADANAGGDAGGSAAREATGDSGPLDKLTERELHVLILVARGLSNAQIAEALDVTQANVKSRVNRILTRLGLENRVQAAILAHEAGLLASE